MNDHARRRQPTEDDAAARRAAIVALVSEARIGSQAELVRLLGRRGYATTQATLSRDLRGLGIGKRPAPDGRAVYALPGPARDHLGLDRQQLELEAFVQEVRVVGNLALVRTPPGNAAGVARAIDLFEWAEVAGTLAGDDTILVVTPDAAQARQFRNRLLTRSRRATR